MSSNSLSNNLSRSVLSGTKAPASLPPNVPENKSGDPLFYDFKLNVGKRKWAVQTVADNKLSNLISGWNPGEVPPRQAAFRVEIKKKQGPNAEVLKAINDRITYLTPSRILPSQDENKSEYPLPQVPIVISDDENDSQSLLSSTDKQDPIPAQTGTEYSQEASSAELKRKRLLKKAEVREAIKTRVTHWTPRDILGDQVNKSQLAEGNNARQQASSSERAQQAAISILQTPVENERLEIASPLIPCAPLRTPLRMLDYHEVLSIGRQLLQYLATKESIDEILTPYNLMYDPRLRYLTISPSVPNQTEMTCYQSPEIILKGPVDVSANVWSLGCTLFKLFTGETLFPIHDRVYFVAKNIPIQPYLRTDLPISSNELLQRMQMQIGLPTKEFLAKCQDAPKYYYIREDQIHFHWYLAIKDLPWRDSILNAAANRGITPSEVFPLIQLLDGMLRYENRPSPHELLCLPLFQQKFF